MIRTTNTEATVAGAPHDEGATVQSPPAVFAVNLDFLRPFLAPCARFVEDAGEADFALAMNAADRPEGDARRLADARAAGKQVAWWTIEDPNSFETFLPQAAGADFVFTTDDACVERYRRRLGHDRVGWLPLACSPESHRPLPLEEGATDFVISANWYSNAARLWAVKTVVDPLVAAGYSLTLFCYEGWPMWPRRYRGFWRGATSYLSTAEQYRAGRVVLGLNNQRSGMDGHDLTYMTSMRTFEVPACGKPLLASHSDAYEHLGFVNGVHMAWSSSPEETLHWAERLLAEEGERVARAGREFVLANHTYAHRLRRIAEVVGGSCGGGAQRC
ncbi:MAG: glycosyltransferase [Acidobacteria bacterium]|nr:glycosyltransferase [Acidobacteriota bacterium]MCA1620648.1 glycosyltransferase [Acidobacteriota bacterium]